VIIYDLTSSQWYFNYIEDEDKCYDMQKLCNKQRRERAKVKRDNDFGLPLENYGYLVRDEQFSLLYWERGTLQISNTLWSTARSFVLLSNTHSPSRGNPLTTILDVPIISVAWTLRTSPNMSRSWQMLMCL
jgi:hypothetical protein